MKTAGPVVALFSVLFACLVFVFVWAGTENVHFEWLAMDGDLATSEVDAALLAATMPAEETAPAQSAEFAIANPKHVRAQDAATAEFMGGMNYVLWINVSGFRPDYLEQTETPFLDSMAKQGSHTSELTPVFPSLHYPTLVSQATGRSVRDHGITSDKVRDTKSGQVVAYPTDLNLLKAEPIWTTAKRQGVGVLVHHWPLSQKQPEQNAADSFVPEVDFTSPAEERLNALLAAWEAHQKQPKLRLLMVSLQDLDVAARAHGTKAKETFQALEKLDKSLADFKAKLVEKWPKLRTNESDRLHIFVTTDRGMVDVKKVINFEALMGDLSKQVDFATSDAIAQLWFKKPPEGTTIEQVMSDYDSELKARIYWRTYKHEDLPKEWKLGTGPLVGDRILMLKSGYAFTDKTGSEPVFDPSETGGPICGSGYYVGDQARMLGQAFFSTLDGKSSGSSLGAVDSSQLHPTVCRILNIEPADGANGRPIMLN